MKILVDSSIPGVSRAFPAPFELSCYSNQNELQTLLKDNEILLCRSTLKVNHELLKNSRIKIVATASSGSDHFNKEELKQAGIRWFAAKGSNAVAVADYVLTILAWFSKYQYRRFKRVGIIGMGKVGQEVSKRYQQQGAELLYYDPLRAEQEISFQSCQLEDLFDCDLISIHANLHDDPVYGSRNLINHNVLKQLKPSTVILNAARGGIVNEMDILTHPEIIYCSDVFENEPEPSKEIIQFSTLCSPHIAGHSIEAKLNATRMASEQIHAAYGLKSPDFSDFYPSVEPTAIKLREPTSRGLSAGSMKLSTSLHPADKPRDVVEVNGLNLMAVSAEPRPMAGQSWQDWALSIYNPSVDTDKLKQCDNIRACFQTIRKAHQFRHDFSAYQAGANKDNTVS